MQGCGESQLILSVRLSLRFSVEYVKHSGAAGLCACLFRLGAQMASSTNMALKKIIDVNLTIIQIIVLFFSAAVNFMSRCVNATKHLVFFFQKSLLCSDALFH